MAVLQKTDLELQEMKTALAELRSALVQTRQENEVLTRQAFLSKELAESASDSLDKLTAVKKDEDQTFKNKIASLEARVRQETATAAKKEEQVNALQFEIRSLQREVAEMKRDASAMSELLTEGGQDADKVFARELVVRQ